MSTSPDYDVVIVGGGFSGALIAKQLGEAGKKVLILESGAGLPTNINAYMERFYTAVAKVPEIPYTPTVFDPDGSLTLSNPNQQNVGRAVTMTLDAGNWQDPNQAYLIQNGPLAFCSTYERTAGGTGRHWLGTSLRFTPNDFRMRSQYGVLVDWPIDYDDLEPWYQKAEAEIGISADVANQAYLGISFPQGYQYPMKSIPLSLVDAAVAKGVTGQQVLGMPMVVTETPAARNSEPYQGRRACAGNTNCIPICPIQAKYDPSVSLNAALNTMDADGNRNVTLWPQTVACNVAVDDYGQVSRIDYLQYEDNHGGVTGKGSVTARRYVIAAHAIETPRLLLMSTNGGKTPRGIANSSDQVGRNLMDHPLYLAWGLAPEPIYGYRGPLSTSGIESTRDGAFRSERAAFRIEIGNEGWNFPIGDPWTTTLDFINGTDASQLNPSNNALWGPELVKALNTAFSRQFRFGFLVEQSPEDGNRVTLSTTRTDHLGLPRPQIDYDLSDYTKAGMVAAKQTADGIFKLMGAKQFTQPPPADAPNSFEVEIDGQSERLKFFGSGHIVGTYRMGDDPKTSVVNADQRSWDHANLFLVGSGVFPTIATGNPTLTLSALALRAADRLLKDLG
ncbi:MAG: GMC family oxidoreductase [Lysobacter sp.]